MRSKDGAELPFPSLELFQKSDPLTNAVLRRVLQGISMKAYGKTLDYGETKATSISKSEAGRRRIGQNHSFLLCVWKIAQESHDCFRHTFGSLMCFSLECTCIFYASAYFQDIFQFYLGNWSSDRRYNIPWFIRRQYFNGFFSFSLVLPEIICELKLKKRTLKVIQAKKRIYLSDLAKEVGVYESELSILLKHWVVARNKFRLDPVNKSFSGNHLNIDLGNWEITWEE